MVWWIDPVGAILISCYIVWSWIGIAREQMNQMVRIDLQPSMPRARRCDVLEHATGLWRSVATESCGEP